MENQGYMQEGLDVKRLLLLWGKKIWVAAVAVMAGALLAGGWYLLRHVVFAPGREYRSVSKLYLNFNCGPEDFNDLAYNGYTWNDLMATDPILDYTMAGLPEGMDRDAVIGATKAEILSDIRLLTITVTTDAPELTARIMEATQKALVHLGETDALFDSIEVYGTTAPRQVVWDNRTANAVVTGAVAGLAAALLALAFYYVLDDSVYTAGDVEKRYGIPVFGIFVTEGEGKPQPYGKEFCANCSYLCRGVKTAALAGVDAGAAETAEKVMRDAADAGKAERMAGNAAVAETAEDGFPRMSVLGNMEEDAGIYRRIRETDGVILAVRYGAGNGKRLERALGNLEKQDCRVLGAVIVDADRGFLRLYYMGGTAV